MRSFIFKFPNFVQQLSVAERDKNWLLITDDTYYLLHNWYGRQILCVFIGLDILSAFRATSLDSIYRKEKYLRKI